MNAPEHGFAGAARHDGIVCAIDTARRRGEILRIQNHHVDWETCQIAIPAENAKSGKARRIPFQRDGRLAVVLEKRRFLGPNACVFWKSQRAVSRRLPICLGDASAHRTQQERQTKEDNGAG